MTRRKFNCQELYFLHFLGKKKISPAKLSQIHHMILIRKSTTSIILSENTLPDQNYTSHQLKHLNYDFSESPVFKTSMEAQNL